MARKSRRKRRWWAFSFFGSFPVHWYRSLNQETKESIIGLLMFLFAALSVLAWFGKAGWGGNILYASAFLLFGHAFLLFPLVLFLLAFSFLFSIERRFFPSVFFGGFLILISTLGFVDILGTDVAERPAGFIGNIVSSALISFLDVWASGVLLAVVLVVGFLVAFNVPLVRKKDTAMSDGKVNKAVAVDTGVITSGEVLDTDAKTQDDKNEEVSGKEQASKTLPDSVVDDVSPASYRDARGVPGEEAYVMGQKLSSGLSAHPKYVHPPFALLEDDKGTPSSGDIKANANIIQRTLEQFGIPVEMGEVSVGPSVTQYTLKPAQGVKLSKISALQNDLALALAAHPLRLEAPIPGRSLVGIEIPNRSIALVRLRSLLEKDVFKNGGPLLFPLGRDVRGESVFASITTMPHLLIAGSTGSGKSISIHIMIMSLLYKNAPSVLKLLLIDPKRVELMHYHDIPHLLSPVVTTAKGAIKALRWMVLEMERRYEMFAEMRARDIRSYNEKTDEPIPFIVVIIDELADIMASNARDIEGSIVRLAQMARAVGIHLVVSTQRPSVEVITGLIKANITSRIAFQVASQVDSRTILDGAGADKLLGNGDMLYQSGDASKPRRIQGAFITEKEVRRVTDFVRRQGKAEYAESFNDVESHPGFIQEDEMDDELYQTAYDMVVKTQKASASYLQRRLRVGYARAARLLDLLEENGVIGPGDGAKPREVLITNDEPADLHGQV
ncbi:MAG: hypothetical protein A3C80_03485 [Candidatus Ryanbacteria bacterium RIFCSPHIGHO2_02_FULL_45_43]|nr:MAG: hypothetical protein A3C80_03485 [Candidatus Ryanbacteria bacterium RIFCSPHIGHO2_02_FULL_45_43]OGZ51128.1 MAG: hypothetical protein A3A17_03790 [Candidatus Ryanbacteria bacterium RIFCSPLOWO2_01_FULL_44_230]